ncbi:stress responsive a b barrel domain protein [Penicillium alfredii]|uniref:Stress responsive a b barrel domain protein n=1 Tax=Penicillium alfredii TaxID=1506179 RepID=A0A9W9F2S7_9EURO|nr:stress responsive a b barrel domain protein [Penicillium alfredii]KAJ5092422.1 stress responsive a b barrel domain protein [Penicillium alfredii]
MTFVHMVLLKFRPEVTQEHKTAFVKELKTLKNLACVKNNRLLFGGPSVTNPIERSKGFEFALVSYHETRAALDEYQYCKEHAHISSTYLYPSYLEDISVFDFQVDAEDEYMCDFGPTAKI